jgi:hypothetical protein
MRAAPESTEALVSDEEVEWWPPAAWLIELELPVGSDDRA